MNLFKVAIAIACLAGLERGPVAFASPVASFLKNADAWFQGEEAARTARNVLSWQASTGGWPKNTDTTSAYAGDRDKLQSTFDNGATTDELRFLARLHTAPGCSNAFMRGLEHILKAQYPNGGWPQFYPPPKEKYHRYITFNDDSMVRLMNFLREVATSNRYQFVDLPHREAAQRAFDRGIDCILKCQIRVDGTLTAWCAQHDEIDLSPRPARSFELASLSGSESVGLVRLLMSLPKPSREVICAVDSAIAWFDTARINSVRLVEQAAPGTVSGKDKTVVVDPTAKPMWARFYEIESNRPIFCGRNGVKKFSLAEIEYERRNGYAWLGYWPAALLVQEYPAWRKKLEAW